MEENSADYARRTERIKNLLSSYYGSADGAQPGTPDGGESPAAGSANYAGRLKTTTTLDSPAYNADRHIAHVLKTYTLDKLLSEHRSMAREIKNLDSDMQQLVYENYNKFIAATDTIRTLKTDVDGMGADMDKLKSIMGHVSDKSNAVNAKLQKRRDHIEELQQVQALLAKLQAVFELPKRMKAALEEDALGTAVDFYAEALPLLKKYGHRGTFRTIAAESEAVAKDISQALKRRLSERKDDTEQSVLLLRKLGEADDTLQDKYLQGRASRLKRILQEASAVADAMAAANTGSPVPPGALASVDAPDSWGFGEGGVPPSLRVFVKCLDERLINAMQETVMNVTSIFLAGDSSAAKRKPLVVLAKESVVEYFRLIRRVVTDAAGAAVHTAARLKEAAADTDFNPEATSLKFSTDWGADTIAQALTACSTDIGLLHSALPELSLRDRAQEVVQQAVRGHVARAFSALEERMQAAVSLLQARLTVEEPSQQGGSSSAADHAAQLSPAFSYTSEAIHHGVSSLLTGLRAYEAHSRLLAPWHDTFVELVQGQLQTLFMQQVMQFQALAHVKHDGVPAYSSGSNSSSPAKAGQAPAAQEQASQSSGAAASDAPVNTGLVLLLAKLCIHMENQTLPHVMETLAAAFPGGGGSGGRGADEPPAFVAGEVGRTLGTAANQLLSAYNELHGRELSLLVRNSVAATNWLEHSEPLAPTPVCDQLLARLAKAEAEVSRLVESSGRGSTGPLGALKRGEHHRGASSVSDLDPGLALESVAVERGVAKLFRDKPKILGTVKFTQASLLAAITAIGLKSLLECIRLQTLGRAGLQQLQLDMQYLRPRLLRFVGGSSTAEAVHALLDDVVSAGVERSVDPSLLEAAALDRILTAAAEQQR